jgi:UDP-glucose 4-epimerase
MARIVVTGSAGFVGRHTVRRLLEAGHRILGIDRNLPAYTGDPFGAYKPMAWDITDYAGMEKAFKRFRPDAVLHLAANASLQQSIETPFYDAHHNIFGTLSILQAAARSSCKRIVMASTSAVYGPKEDGLYLETDPVAPQSPYGVSKATGEMYCACSGLSWAALRYGNVYGPGQKPLGENILIARALAHMLDHEPFQINGDGEQVRDWIYVKDVAEANLKALESENQGVFNIATGRGFSVNRIIDELGTVTGHADPIPFGPAKPGELRRVVMYIGRARMKLGWEAQVTLAEGLAETVRAWKTERAEQPQTA